MRIRLRGPNGSSTITIPQNARIHDLVQAIKAETSLTNFSIHYGYPPRLFPLDFFMPIFPLEDLEMNLDGEQLTIGAREDPESQELPTDGEPQSQRLQNPISIVKQPKDHVTELHIKERDSFIVLRVMPDDNSCMFRALAAAVLPGDDQAVVELRSLVASKIQDNPSVYPAVVLEEDPDDYCQWIQTPDAWGGAIELKILSEHFDIEVCSIDVQSLRIDRYNPGRPTRCILLYSGIHYDTIVESWSPSDPDQDVRIWHSWDEMILEHAGILASELRGQHYFTDTSGMKIKCGICGELLIGQAEASEHARIHNHWDMAEVSEKSN